MVPSEEVFEVYPLKSASTVYRFHRCRSTIIYDPKLLIGLSYNSILIVPLATSVSALLDRVPRAPGDRRSKSQEYCNVRVATAILIAIAALSSIRLAMETSVNSVN